MCIFNIVRIILASINRLPRHQRAPLLLHPPWGAAMRGCRTPTTSLEMLKHSDRRAYRDAALFLYHLPMALFVAQNT